MTNKPLTNQELIDYLEHWRMVTSYEASAMSEASFSSFLEGLLELLRPQNDEDEEDE